jgi:ATP-binding cassette, subfamily C (CFTR/MRP), member 1
MSTDTSRIDFAAGYCHMGWVSLVQVCIILAILIVNIGPSALAGFGLLICSAPILGRIVRKLVTKRLKSTKFTDARVRITQEILSSMRVIKYYAWERSFLKKVIDLRETELKIVRFLLLMRAGINAVSMTIPIYASILAFVTYSLTGHGLNPANIFSSLTLFNLLRMPLMFLPIVFAACTDAYVSLGRMQSLLLSEEIEDNIVIDHDAEFAISVTNGRFVWELELKEEPTADKKEKKKRHWWQRKSKAENAPQTPAPPQELESESDEEDGVEEIPAVPGKNDLPMTSRLDTDFIPFQVEEHEQVVEVAENHAMDASRVSPPGTQEALDTVPLSRIESTPDPHRLQRIKDINIQISRGEFVVVVGEIGAGKSSLLSALVGEMRKTDGTVLLGGTVGYCPQTAWIQNATVKSNILFGRDFDPDKYDAVIQACALLPDFEMLPNGDATEIGERGINLSGGQKTRINIARAAYHDADIVLLDDPLSAVDAHVGRQLLEECICGIMAGKTRVLVTHQLHVLPRADRIFCMRQGKIVEQGTYDELVSHGGAFARLIEEYGGKEEETKEEQEEVEEDVIEEIEEKKKKKHESKPQALMQIEERAVGSVAWSVYAEYAKAGGGLWVIPAIIFTVMCCNGVNIATSLWLSYWTSNKYNLSEGTYVGIYAALGASQAVFFFIFGYALTMTGNKATGNLHAKVSHPSL